jgi:DNA-directed RNA polymerase specialized sigma24 family protein
VERVTIAEAAALLGCHPNTVRNRVKAGMYRAEKPQDPPKQRSP